jgi:hypothetical protein
MHSSEVEYSQISPVILSTPSTNSSLSSELLKIANSTPTYITDLERVFSSALRDLKVKLFPFS